MWMALFSDEGALIEAKVVDGDVFCLCFDAAVVTTSYDKVALSTVTRLTHPWVQAYRDGERPPSSYRSRGSRDRTTVPVVFDHENGLQIENEFFSKNGSERFLAHLALALFQSSRYPFTPLPEVS
jgi:hypothetical protein